MDRYQLGFEIARLVCMSNEPLEEIKYLTRILRQMHHMYLDRERIRYCVHEFCYNLTYSVWVLDFFKDYNCLIT